MEMREYFRIEATELIGRMTADLRAIAGGSENAEQHWREMQRAAHTLKGAAHVVRQAEMAQTAHVLEDAIAQRSIEDATSAVDRLAEMLDGMFQALPAASAEDVKPQAKEAQEPVAAQTETVRVDVGATDKLLAAIAQCNAALSSLRSAPEEIASFRNRVAQTTRLLRNADHNRALQNLLQTDTYLQAMGSSLEERIASLRRAVEEAERLTTSLRLTAAQPMLLRVERTARRTAEQLGITIRCELSGGEEHIDLHLLAQVEDALSHAARNAVAHGLRHRSGRVDIGVRRLGSMLEFLCRDNGAGIDVEQLRIKAAAQGWMTAEEARTATRARLLEMLSRPGVTTSATVDATAGRGIGLDVVRTVARRLRGTMEIESEPGIGTTVSLRVPEDLFALPAAVLVAGETEFAVPLSAVEQTMQPNGHRSKEHPFGREIVLGGELVPVLNTAELLGIPRGLRSGRVAVLLRVRSGKVALPVDQVKQMEELVTEAVPAAWQAQPWVAGTYRDSAGRPRLFLDPAEISVERFQARQSAQTAQVKPHVLVIDDSLTSRMLQEGILVAAGYPVDTATSAEEALVMARRRSYGLFLVDVEMPGMDGFGFVETTRKDMVLRQIPVIMVTSRNQPGDRERGLRLGASEYIVKGNFDQEKLLSMVARLTSAGGK